MKIRHITKSELLEFANKAASYYLGNIPITPWRAESQVANPFAKNEDILLIVAEEDKKLLGYIGILPGKPLEKSSDRLYWNSCWWVEVGAGAKVSLTLLSEFMKVTDKQVAFSDLSERTKEIIKKLGFSLNERKGIIFNLKSALHQRISSKKKADVSGLYKFLSATALLKFLDFGINLICPLRLKNDKSYADISLEKLWIPTPEIFSYIKKTSQNQITIPNELHFNWWLKSRWLMKETKERQLLSERYFFSSLANNFELFLLKVQRGNQILGIALLGIRDGVVKTHYLWYEMLHAVVFFESVISHITYETENHRIITFHEEFSEYLKGKVKNRSRVKEVKRFTAISDVISGIDLKYNFQDGDGDYIFT
ncbi:MAG: hypothetical protein K9H49_11440 [Bacteroidales bacterium]|nr:hypothetical protein [Bacteroidales bacterium]MCF8390850.1 hypothetical protein [Bacteroidales bacterium]